MSINFILIPNYITAQDLKSLHRISSSINPSTNKPQSTIVST